MTYAELEVELGITSDMVEDFHRMKTVSAPAKGLVIAPSDIEGMGVVTTKARQMGDFVGKAVVGTYRTAYGRYLNNSDAPNVVISASEDFQESDSILYIQTLHAVPASTELTVDYRSMFNRGAK
jgi:hypothetical protein